ncbi:STAS domain-containing protein [Aidingimonas halophila]|uniref:Phospholipid transport system transporter-binding protein n=1 Tax=Aidingimonas halophila TaxID=574349 RepID=A0A1H2QWY2_9GAMM|nr:STAS domain-containing protein [Aidingimonas halophila]GHC20146.1 hypothetical protein GCM10008094_07930 [Aidingimonas halophila]SDW11677.1 phospholipid transport system transporter-binding protein [Aidingimonas halophila]
MTLLLNAQGARLSAMEQRLVVSGDVDFDVATVIADAGRQWLVACPPNGEIELDFGGVDRVSSAALSVMLEWMRCAVDAGLTVRTVILSPPLRRLTEVASLDALLPAD